MEYWMEVFRDIVIYLVSLFGMAIYSKKATPTQRGFYCDDESIRLHYKHYKTWHVTNGTLFGVSISVPILFMVALEYWRVRNAAAKVNVKTPWHLVGYHIHITLRNWALAFNLVAALTEVLKHLVGRLRPHFVDVCSPDWDAITCTGNDGEPLYITDIPCKASDLLQPTGLDEGHQIVTQGRIKESRKSFPSGHAVISSFAMVYVVIYLQARLQHVPRIVKLLLQAICLYFTLYTSVTRVLDHAHHSTDVMAGFSIGAISAIMSTRYASKIFCDSDIINSENRKIR